jgi:hypothetical protein
MNQPDGGSPSHPDMAMKKSSGSQPDMAKSSSSGPVDMAPAPLGMLVCETDLSLAGTFTQSAAPPTGFPGGCWPTGSWTFTATVTTNGCSPTPPLQAQYQFTVVEDNDFNDTITYVNDPSNMYVATKISGGEGGVCVGAFQIYSSDGKTIYNLRPAMQADNSINGQGDVREYTTDQRN